MIFEMRLFEYNPYKDALIITWGNFPRFSKKLWKKIKTEYWKKDKLNFYVIMNNKRKYSRYAKKTEIISKG